MKKANEVKIIYIHNKQLRDTPNQNMQNMISKILNVMEVSKYIGILDCVQTRDHQLKMKRTI